MDIVIESEASCFAWQLLAGLEHTPLENAKTEISNGFPKWTNKLEIANNSVINVCICQVRDHEIDAHRSISSDVDDQQHFNRIASFCQNLR
ncbi:hypothetical protein ACTXT7_017041 [Hymenolepis weldensis]